MSIFSLALSLFVLMDPIGNIPLFLSILKKYPLKKQLFITFRELVIALAIIVVFYFLGGVLLHALGVRQSTVQIAGGIILFLIALKMIFPSSQGKDTELFPDKEVFIVPLAVPFVAGPAVLAAVMLYSQENTSHFVVLSAILLAWIPSTIILLSSTFLKQLLGARGLTACERLMGLLLTLIAVQMFLEGISLYLKTCL